MWYYHRKIEKIFDNTADMCPESSKTDASSRIVRKADTDRLAQPGGSIPILSLTAPWMRCLQPRYRSVVCIETCPSRNWICSSSPPAAWQSRAQVLRRSWGASLSIPALAAYSRTTCHMAFSVRRSPHAFPILCTRRNSLPDVRLAASTHWSRISFTHIGIGIVRICPALPFRSTMAQCCSRC